MSSNQNAQFNYETFITRNIGFVTAAEQNTLRYAKVLIIGVGGMGGVALQCLVRAGVGEFIFADIDTFEVSNLNRQIFSNVDNLGLDKAESAKKQILSINPHCKVESMGEEWLGRLDELVPRADIIINGCDDARATIQLMRKAQEYKKTVIDAFASPLPSVYVVKPRDPRPEVSFGYPTVGKKFEDLTLDDAKECAAREIEYVMSQSSSANHVELDIAAEMISGKRKRISFAPMVWATGVLMAYEVVRVLLKKPGGPGPLGVFLNPWTQKYEHGRKGLMAKIKLFFVRRFLKQFAGQAAIILLTGLSIFMTGCLEAPSDTLVEYRGQNGNQAAEDGAVHFLLSDFGGLNSDTLNTNALPWKVTATYLLIRKNRELGTPVAQSALPSLLQRYGFITPKKIDNWPVNLPMPQMKMPAGLVKGTGHMPPGFSMEISNINCSACHSGTNYDSSGNPTMTMWLGLPNTSINIEGYTLDVYAALKEAALGRSAEEVVANVKRVYPDLSSGEEATIKLSFRTVKSRVEKIAKTVDKPTPFSSGNPGVTNGVASLKRMLGVVKSDSYHSDETAFTAVPDLSDRYLRSSLLYDGVYSIKNELPFRPLSAAETPRSRIFDLGIIIGFFNTPVQGQKPSMSEKNLPLAKKAVAFLENYRRPDFPGEVDLESAGRGQKTFEQNCAQCHGNYTGNLHHLELAVFPNKLIPATAIGTDPQRATLIGVDTQKAVMASRMGKYMDANLSKGYVAPILSGLWASAPYFHNGSVPSLWQVMNPELRQSKFYVGGHKLDFETVGLSYPTGYKPWSQPYLYDTSNLGRSNKGHEKQFAPFGVDQKRDLLEFLKLI